MLTPGLAATASKAPSPLSGAGPGPSHGQSITCLAGRELLALGTPGRGFLLRGLSLPPVQGQRPPAFGQQLLTCRPSLFRAALQVPVPRGWPCSESVFCLSKQVFTQ